MKPFNSHGQSFTEIPIGSPKRSSFNKTYTHKSSGRMGKIIPIHCKEVMPAENLRLSPEALLRFEPLAVPMLSACYQRIHNYVVPMRQLWTNWEQFITRGKTQDVDLDVPYIRLNDIVQSLTSRYVGFASSFNIIYRQTPFVDLDDKHVDDLWHKSGITLAPPARLLTDWFTLYNNLAADEYDDNVKKLISQRTNLNQNDDSMSVFYKIFGELSTTDIIPNNLFGKRGANYLFYPVSCAGGDKMIGKDFSESYTINLTYNQLYRGLICILLLNHLNYMRYYYFMSKEQEEKGLLVPGYTFAHIFRNTYTSDILEYEILPLIDSLMVEVAGHINYSVQQTGSAPDALISSNISSDALQNLISRVFYEPILKPFVGESSVWSYLGYPALTEDMYQAASWHTMLEYNVLFATSARCYPAFVLGNVDDLRNSDYLPNDNLQKSIPEFIFENTTRFSILPLRGLYRVWWYNYRDQRIEVDATDPDTSEFKSDYANTSAYISHVTMLLLPRYIAWAKDTFTTATLNSFTSNVIVPLGDDINVATISVQVNELDDNGNVVATDKQVALPQSCISQGSDIPRLGLDGLSLSMLRKCQALASWLDKNLFLGYQYADQLYSHYGVKYSDARLQIPEYVGGDSKVVSIEVITNNTNVGVDPENLVDVAGRQSSRMQGYALANTNGYFSEEHAISFSLMSVLPESSYPDAVDRSLLMANTYDVAFPEFAQTGSDIIATGEVAFNPLNTGNSTNLEPFGYQGRYYHYKSNPDRVSGNLRTTRKEFTFARFFQNPDADVLTLPENIVVRRESPEVDFDVKDYLAKQAYLRPTLTPEFVHCLPTTLAFVSRFDDNFIFDSRLNDIEQLPLPIYDEVL